MRRTLLPGLTGPPITTRTPVSVIMPVRNEERHLAEAVRHVLAQDYPGAIEVVLAVGPSGDATLEVAERLAAADPRVRVLASPTGLIPTGGNLAIGAARYPIVARVDGHALIPPDYLRVAVQTMLDTGADNVGGVMAADGVTAFQQAVAWAMTSPAGVGSACFHTGGPGGPADSVYLGVYRRAALERVGGYDEGYERAEDWELNHRIRRAGGLIWFQPRLRVTYRPRATARALAKQYFHYGRWRRVVSRQHPGTISPRYLAPPVAVLAMAAGLAAGVAGVVADVVGGARPAGVASVTHVIVPAAVAGVTHVAGPAGVAGALGSSPLRWLALGFLIPGAYLAGILGVTATASRALRPGALARLPLALAIMHVCWGAGFLTSPRRLARRTRAHLGPHLVSGDHGLRGPANPSGLASPGGLAIPTGPASPNGRPGPSGRRSGPRGGSTNNGPTPSGGFPLCPGRGGR
jgi:succinoglycan biosynthesis protein ExoA